MSLVVEYRDARSQEDFARLRRLLALRALVDGLSHQFPLAVEDKGSGHVVDMELPADFAAAVDQYRRVIGHVIDEAVDLEGAFTGDRQNNQCAAD